MGLGRRASLQRQFDGGEHGLFIMLENQGQNLDHLAVAARRLEHALLQSPEGRRQFDKRRAIAQGSGLAPMEAGVARRPPANSGRFNTDHLSVYSSPRKRRFPLQTSDFLVEQSIHRLIGRNHLLDTVAI